MTRVHSIFGQKDTTGAVACGNAFLDRLYATGSPLVSEETIAGMGHAIDSDPSGIAALEAAIEA